MLRLGRQPAAPRPAQETRDPLLALRAGDPEPFEAFVRAHARTFVAYFLRHGARLGRAEDLTQDLFLRMVQSAERYRPQERFVAYAFQLARNLWIDDCRRAGASPEAWPPSAPEPIAAAGDPGDGMLRAEEEQRLDALLRSLPSGQREVLELAVLGELAYEEIAALLAIPVGTVKSRMFHAVRRLRLLWGLRGPLARVREERA